MSGTYKIDGTLFIKNPIAKRWQRQQVATGGAGEPIYSRFWNLELSFGTLDTDTEIPFFETRWQAGGLHTMVLPHPSTAELVGFTGVALLDFSYELDDIDSDGWGVNPRLMLGHIDLSATGTV